MLDETWLYIYINTDLSIKSTPLSLINLSLFATKFIEYFKLTFAFIFVWVDTLDIRFWSCYDCYTLNIYNLCFFPREII